MNATDPIQTMDFIDIEAMATECGYPVTLLAAAPRLAHFLHASSAKAACKEKDLG